MITTIGALRHALKAAISATGANAATLVASDEGLVIKAANTLASVSVRVKDVEGKCFVGSASITSAAANAIFATVATDTSVTIKQTDKGLQISFGGARLKLAHREDESEIFSMDEKVASKTHLLTMKGCDLAKMFAAVVNFAAKKDVRYYLNGVFVNIDAARKQIETVGTDGFALARFKPVSSDEVVYQASTDIIVPHAASHALATGSVFGGNSVVQVDQMAVATEKGNPEARRLVLSSEDVTWNVALIAGRFPDYNRILNNSDPGVCKTILSTPEFAGAVARVLALSDDKFVRVNITSEQLTVQDAKSEQIDRVACESGLNSADAAFNGSMLLDALSAIQTPKVCLIKSMDGASRMFVEPVFDDVDAQRDSWVAVVMPYKF